MRFSIMGGGCYGTFYARQLLRARAAGALAVEEIRVVDSAERCRARAELESAPPLRFRVQGWDAFLDSVLADAPGTDEILVTPPFTPHLALAWLLRTLPRRRPGSRWTLERFARLPGTPLQHQREGGPLLVSHADWICPIHCIEPDRCPRTHGPRHWDLDRTVRDLAADLAGAGQPVDVVELFLCHHIAYGVGGFPLGRLPDAAGAILRGTPPGGRALVGTVSHCHGALHLVRSPAGPDIDPDAALRAGPHPNPSIGQ